MPFGLFGQSHRSLILFFVCKVDIASYLIIETPCGPYQTLSAFLSLGKTIPYCDLEGMSLYGSIPPQTTCVPCLCGRAGFDPDPSHIFLKDMLATILLVGGGATDGGARTGASVRWGLPSVQEPSLLCRGRVCPKLLEQKPIGSGRT